MIDKIKKALQDASDVIKDQTSSLSEGAKEKTYQLIDEWLQIFPKLEIYGLEVNSFGLSVALSPALEAELIGDHKKFTPERINQILQENKSSAALTSVFTTIKTAYTLHRKTYANLRDPLIVKIKVKITPEINVIIGEPLIQ
ncbi:hypothetical protein [Flavilitoribacter nigricans]|uniref:Uncharacterized protein n=1 Tax=Flavilitoribacter nigricans (strain ATCC 23147 / DSM 23189 / NBRC 102662 / NCIMB 1420 / SS-2) TaxID=1122177 RepID=A0A2D0NGR5_FLAN2|nr:hypothetical protein [Flavilitoribacter nigricans]PHN07677.1 hypothetical protein CRP01_06140 [Flavilitoribacter nigricans DSM 23189 = NBRC 102662]